MKPDFSGYATKAGLKCSDGRTITPEAFKHMDGVTVPLVWQHGHNEPANVLGHAKLEARKDGVYAYGYFNDTPSGKQARALVEHKDVKSLSIYANELIEKAKSVLHGKIKEVSLVLSGANPGAFIDNVSIRHSDGEIQTLDDEAVIHSGLPLEHEDEPDGDEGKKDDEGDEGNKDEEGKKDDENVEHSADNLKLQEIYDSLNDEQKNLVDFMVGTAAERGSASHSDDDDEDLEHQEGKDDMSRNVFDQNSKGGKGNKDTVLSHSDFAEIVEKAKNGNRSLRHAFEEYAIAHGIDNIDMLFPDAKDVNGGPPDWIKRRTEWVAGVLDGTHHSPFSRIKTRTADITHDQARALGYIKGNMKKEEFFGVTQRTTAPTTVYKKQKLDRDDMLDITDYDVVLWLKGEMRLMLEEELARAILIGDGRPTEDPANPGEPNPDKIKDPVGATDGVGIRSILHDHELYVTHVTVGLPALDPDYNVAVEELMRARRFYKGSGTPTFYTTNQTAVEMLLSKDGFGRRRWATKEELAASMGVKSIVEVEVMDQEEGLLGIIVNLQDYNVGTDRGGEINTFDDFDIDYNQHKYLIETRLSGALTKIKSAIVLERVDSGTNTLTVPVAPEFDGEDLLIPTSATQNWTVDGVAAADGATVPVAAGHTAHVKATPAAGYYFATNEQDEWDFTGEV